MTWPATEEHANPFPQSESMSQQRATEVVTSTRPLSRGSLNKVCWKKEREKKKLFQRFLANWLKKKKKKRTVPAKNARGLRRAICDAGSLSFGSAVLFFTGCQHEKWEIRLNFGPDENLWWQVWWHFKGKVTSGHLSVTGNPHYQQGGYCRFSLLKFGLSDSLQTILIFLSLRSKMYHMLDDSLTIWMLFCFRPAVIIYIVLILLFTPTSPMTVHQNIQSLPCSVHCILLRTG